MRIRRRRQRGQAIVEFGIIALLFTALMFAVVDFGLLLNTWLAVSAGTRDIARSAAVGKDKNFLTQEAQNANLPSVDTSGFVGGACCGSNSARFLSVTYIDGSKTCSPWPDCAVVPLNTVSSTFYDGACPSGCAHPVPNDYVKVTFVAEGAQVITPLLRPFFGCTNGNNPKCHVPLTSTVIMRFEGQEFP